MENIDLYDKWAVVALPPAATSVKITANVIVNGKALEVSRALDLEEMRKGPQEGKDFFIPDGAQLSYLTTEDE